MNGSKHNIQGLFLVNLAVTSWGMVLMKMVLQAKENKERFRLKSKAILIHILRKD